LVADNEKEFINSISLLFEDASLRNKCSINGYALVNEIYKWEKIAEKMEEIYSNIMKNNLLRRNTSLN
jgi:glycosyltransferase involved in cell wall biosynthesis